MTPEQEAKCREAFVIKHYVDDPCPTIKFDGGYIEIHGDRQDAEEFLSAILQAAWSAAQAGWEDLVEAKNQAYWERNRLVAILARLYPSGRAVTDISGWDAAWHNCIYIDLPTGQASWHIHENEMVQFASLPKYTKPWDGHTTEEKYRRLLLLLLRLEGERTPPTQPSGGEGGTHE